MAFFSRRMRSVEALEGSAELFEKVFVETLGAIQ
jgi:hypothetical protein